MQDVHQTHDVEDLPKQVADAAEAGTDQAKMRVEELARQAKDAAGQAYQQARGAAAAVTATVEHQPVVAMLVVGALCGVLGFLLARR